MPIQAILFDYGSVLVQMVDEAPRQQLADRYGIPLARIYHLVFDTEGSVQAALGEITIQHHWRAIHEILHIPPGERDEFIRQFWAADGLNQELVDYLPTLRERYALGLLSNANDDLRQALIERWQIDGLFDDMIISAEVGLLKPDRRIYQLAVNRLAGLQAIQYINNQQVRKELNEMLQVAGSRWLVE
jgi:HAD superfamily hydrolase (TIGR01549 family)